VGLPRVPRVTAPVHGKGDEVIDHPEDVELTPGERVVLDDIERSLAAVDPRLAARLATHRPAGERWQRARLPVGGVAAVAGLAGMVACSVAGEVAAGMVAVAVTAGGTVAAVDAVRDRLRDAGVRHRARRTSRRPPGR
jgi:Protein of unknown function (DUF3040)